jgi:hypothetical protein
LTSFVVGEVVEVKNGRFVKNVSTLTMLNVFWVIFMAVGCCLDRSKQNVREKSANQEAD